MPVWRFGNPSSDKGTIEPGRAMLANGEMGYCHAGCTLSGAQSALRRLVADAQCGEDSAGACPENGFPGDAVALAGWDIV